MYMMDHWTHTDRRLRSLRSPSPSGYVFASVFLSVSRITEKAVVEFFMKNFGGVGYVTCNRRLDFGGDPDLDHYADTGILRNFYYCRIREAGGWFNDSRSYRRIVMKFCEGRDASPVTSRLIFFVLNRIAIRIRENRIFTTRRRYRANCKNFAGSAAMVSECF